MKLWALILILFQLGCAAKGQDRFVVTPIPPQVESPEPPAGIEVAQNRVFMGHNQPDVPTGGGGGTVPLSPTATLASLTAHNGVAAAGPNLTEDWVDDDYGAFPGWTNGQTDTADPIISQAHAVPGNISEVSFHSYFPSWDTKILAEMQGWFTAPEASTVTIDGVSYPSAGSHLMNGTIDGELTNAVESVGGSSASQKRANALVRYFHSVGIDGVHLVLNGNPEGCGQRGGNALSGSNPYVPGSTTWVRDCGNSSARKRVGYLMLKFKHAMQNLAEGNGQVILPMYEESGYKTTANCGTENTNQVKCVEEKIRADMDWLKDELWETDQAAVMVKSGKEQPVISFFFSESILFGACTSGSPCATLEGSTCTSRSTCWTKVFDELTTWFGTQTITRNASTYALSPWFLFRDQNGSAHNESGGAFLWVPHDEADGSSITTATQENWLGTGLASPSRAQAFYNIQRCGWSSHSACTTAFPTYKNNRITVASIYKGFDSRFADWKRPNNEVMSQRCGQTLVDSVAQISAVHPVIGSANFGVDQPPFAISINTWDDYEEGTGIEMGIDNCYSAGRSLATSTLTCSVSSADPYADPKTLDHYEVWATTDGTNVQQLGALTIDSPTMNLASALAHYDDGDYTIYCRAVAKPGIINRLSSGIGYTK